VRSASPISSTHSLLGDGPIRLAYLKCRDFRGVAVDTVIRAFLIYIFLLIILRISGKRTMAQITVFDFVLLLVVAEATQNAMLGKDYSITTAMLVIMSLVGLNIAFSLLKHRWPGFDRLVEGMPLVIVENGKPLKERMDKLRVDEDDILSAARSLQGLERMDQIKYAVVERSGSITIVPQ
jgi:uncharacterized membrane protein YcaP (DUF421 family)